MTHSSKFSIPDIRDFIPEKIKPWIIILFLFIFQISGGLYLASVTHIMGAISLMYEDIMMCGYATLVGLALNFTIMYRLKFRFPLKTSLITCASVLILCNIACIYVTKLPSLMVICFISGFFRMWGTFACNSTVHQWITPTREMSIWQCFIQVIVMNFIVISGVYAVTLTYFFDWQYVHWLTIALLIMLIISILILIKSYRSMKKLPLYGIDWMGLILWAATVLSAAFVLNYGEYYDWFDSKYIIIGTLMFIQFLCLNLWRASFIRHPYIDIKTMQYKNVRQICFLFLLMAFITAPTGYLEQVYTSSIQNFDPLNKISLNLVSILAYIIGAIFSLKTFAQKRWKVKSMLYIGFGFLFAYLLIMYFTVEFRMPIESLYFPIFLRSFGYIILNITLITATARIPFKHFFQALTFETFVSAIVGPLIALALFKHFFHISLLQNGNLLGINFDSMNSFHNGLEVTSFMNIFHQHCLLITIKEMYGWLCFVGLLSIVIIIISDSNLKPDSIHPKFSTIRKLIKHDLKFENE
jgi:MFS transporter, DHA2 family, multidrug resistance protein